MIYNFQCHKISPPRNRAYGVQQGALEVLEFYSKLMGLWSELENQVRFPRCSCGSKCKCGIGEKLIKMVDEEKAINF